MNWGRACLLVILVGAAAQTYAASSLRDVSERWAEYYATVYQLPLDLVEAIIDEESGWNPYA